MLKKLNNNRKILTFSRVELLYLNIAKRGANNSSKNKDQVVATKVLQKFQKYFQGWPFVK